MILILDFSYCTLANVIKSQCLFTLGGAVSFCTVFLFGICVFVQVLIAFVNTALLLTVVCFT